MLKERYDTEPTEMDTLVFETLVPRTTAWPGVWHTLGRQGRGNPTQPQRGGPTPCRGSGHRSMHHIIFQLPKQITATSHETCLTCPGVEHAYDLGQGGWLDELEGSHRIPFVKKCRAATLTLSP